MGNNNSFNYKGYFWGNPAAFMPPLFNEQAFVAPSTETVMRILNMRGKNR